MAERPELKWVSIDPFARSKTHTSFAAVAGGWLVRTWFTGSDRGETGFGGAGLTFIPDPEHKTPPVPVDHYMDSLLCFYLK